MLKFAKPIIGLFLFVVFVASFLLTPAVVMANNAEGPPPMNIGGARVDAESVSAAIDSPTPNLANTTAYVLYTVLVVMCRSFGDEAACSVGQNETASADGPSYASTNPDNVSQAVESHGLIGGVGFLTAELVANPPVSAQAYVADVAANSRFGATPAYAQGFGVGFGALTPILGTWKAFRDVAYYLLTIVFLIVGFLILIRHKVSGNVAVTVQNALPRLVITLILITFSYAIAGLVVDAMFLAIYFLTNTFQSQIFSNSVNARELAFDRHFFQFIFEFIFSSTGAWRAAEALGHVVYEAFSAGLSGITDGVGLDEANLGFLQTLISIIFILIFAIALLISMFRTFFQLIMSYAGFVVNVVLSPFILLGGAIPGKGDAFGGWLKNLIAGLAPFVVVIFMIFMALALTGGEYTKDGIGYDTDSAATSGEIDGLRLPLILTGSVDSNAVVGILAMGILLMIPESVELTKKMIGAKGGIFDEFKDKALGNLKQGWTGNKYVPGAKSIGGLAARTAVSPLTSAAGAGATYLAARKGWLGDSAQQSPGRAALAGGLATGLGTIVGPKNALRLGKKPLEWTKSVKGYTESTRDLIDVYGAAQTGWKLGGLPGAAVAGLEKWDANAAARTPRIQPQQSNGTVPGGVTNLQSGNRSNVNQARRSSSSATPRVRHRP